MFFFRRLSRSLFFLSLFVCLLLIFIFSRYSNENSRPTKPRVRKPYNFRQTLNEAERTRSNNRTNAIKIADRRLEFYVHFDLKGAAPKIDYFEKLFPLLRRWGVTGVCMEYEDMFPFDSIVQSVRHKQAYTKNEIKIINQLAEDNHLDVMPLLQTYGK